MCQKETRRSEMNQWSGGRGQPWPEQSLAGSGTIIALQAGSRFRGGEMFNQAVSALASSTIQGAATEHTREALQVLGEVLDKLGIGLISLSSAGHPSLLNRTAQELPQLAASLELLEDGEGALLLRLPQMASERPFRRLGSEGIDTVLCLRPEADQRERAVHLIAREMGGLNGQGRSAVLAFRELTIEGAELGQLVAWSRYRSLAELVSGIVHDFNNALLPVVGFSELLLESFAATPALREGRAFDQLRMINTAARDAAKTVRRLRELYRADTASSQCSAVELKNILELSVSLTEPKWRGECLRRGISIEVETRIKAQPLVLGDEAALREVLLNLLLNAIDAMPQGGRITVSLDQESPGPAGDDGRSAELAIIRVSDTGVGMSEEVKARCTEPFYSTKGRAGSGLGLAMVRKIVAAHRGSLEIASKVGEGTTFTICLPTHPRTSRQVAEESGSRFPRALKVLVVDDDPRARATLVTYLEHDGHRVEIATTGAEALQKFHGGWFELIVLDQAMPELTGERLARLIRQTAPQKPLIMVTGFADEPALEALPDGASLILHKPVTRADLRSAITRVMGSGS